jgi:glycine cleavage system H protein
MNPAELKYLKTHEWVGLGEDGLYCVGISAHAAEALGDVTYVELPAEGAALSQGSEAGSVESVKAASDVYAPVSGRVTAVNEALNDTPELVNSEPYGAGWFFKLEDVDPAELDNLMDSETYEKFAAEEEH